MRSRRTLAAWLALFAMAMQALWPLVAQAKPADPQLLVPICTVGGDVHYVAMDGKTGEKPATATGEHCKLCVFGGAKLALPPLVAIPVLQFEPAVVVVRSAPAADVLPFLSVPPAPPRAPPLVSL